MIKLMQGDCIAEMQKMESNIIDLTVTSPPYDNLRTYAGTLDWNFDIFKKVANELYRITKDGGVVVWAVGDATIKGSETGTSFRQALYFKEIGFNLHDTMIYQKSGMGACGSNSAYWQNFEYMFILSKGKLKTFNPIEDRKNVKKAGRKEETTTRRSQESSRTIRRVVNKKEFGKRFNVWQYNTGLNRSTKDKIAFDHPAIFPEQLANDHIISWSNENDVVFDPFMGSGTTGKMAKLNNRKFIGIEKVPKYFDIAKERIENA